MQKPSSPLLRKENEMDKTVSVKTHLIITDIHEEYNINWCGRLIDSNPVLKNGMPIFVVAGSNGRMELNTIDMKQIEEWGKKMTYPRGRKAITTDKAYIYIKEKGGSFISLWALRLLPYFGHCKAAMNIGV